MAVPALVPRLAAAAASAVLAATTTSPTPGAEAESASFSMRWPADVGQVMAGPDGTIYVAGSTSTPNLPASTTTPVVPEFRSLHYVTALAPDGAPRWTSYVQGWSDSSQDPSRGWSLALGPDGAVWLAGSGAVEVASGLQPQPAGGSDGWIAKFSKDGALQFATNLGGSDADWVTGLAVRPDGDAIVVGTTASFDFAPSPPIDPGCCSLHAFVLRVRADGSGFAFAGLLPNLTFGGGVALDAEGRAIVAAGAGSADALEFPSLERLTATGLGLPDRDRLTVSVPFVLRVDHDGLVLDAASAAFVGAAGFLVGSGSSNAFTRLPVAVDADGSVILGGAACVARIAADLSSVVAVRSNPKRTAPLAIALHPDGRVLVRRTRGGWFAAPIDVLDRGLDRVATVDDFGGVSTAIAVHADGSLVAAGWGVGTSFRETYVPDWTTYSFIAKRPVDGVEAASDVTARAISSDTVEVSWVTGDVPERFDVERVFDPYGVPPVAFAGAAAGDAKSLRIGGLVPGGMVSFRVVSVFASGVRTASYAPYVTTPPLAPTNVVAASGANGHVQVSWDTANGSVTAYQLQRRIGSGPWLAWTDDWQWYGRQRVVDADASPVDDVVPDVAEPVRYRVRAVADRMRTAWVESPPLISGATLFVAQETGRIGPVDDGIEFTVRGTISAAGSATAAVFDPATQEFRLLYGDAKSPSQFVLPAGDPGWSGAAGTWTWRASDTLTQWIGDSAIVLDLAAGRFSAHLVSPRATFVQDSRVVVFNLGLGELSGGDVRAWRGRTGRQPRLVLR